MFSILIVCVMVQMNADYTFKGGHFAALEQPEIFLQDVEDFVESWKSTVET